MPVNIRRVRPTEGEQFRAIRLRALADSPAAFASTLAETEARPTGYWETRVRDGAAGEGSVLFVAEEDTAWIGLAGGYVDETDGTQVPYLISMWVDPAHRGRGIGGALVERVIAWARDRSFERLVLEVEATNASAISLYTRYGFRPTGTVQPHPTYAGLEEILMEIHLHR